MNCSNTQQYLYSGWIEVSTVSFSVAGRLLSSHLLPFTFLALQHSWNEINKCLNSGFHLVCLLNSWNLKARADCWPLLHCHGPTSSPTFTQSRWIFWRNVHQWKETHSEGKRRKPPMCGPKDALELKHLWHSLVMFFFFLLLNTVLVKLNNSVS